MIKYRFSNPNNWESFWDDIDNLFNEFIDPPNITTPNYIIDVVRTDDNYADKGHQFQFFILNDELVFMDDFNFNDIKWILLSCNKKEFQKLLKYGNKIR